MIQIYGKRIPTKVISNLRNKFFSFFALSRIERVPSKRVHPTLVGAIVRLARNYFFSDYFKNKSKDIVKLKSSKTHWQTPSRVSHINCGRHTPDGGEDESRFND